MANPYVTPASAPDPEPRRRGVRRYIVLAMLSAMMAGCIAIPGFRLLSQERGWYPTNSYITGIEFNGRPVSNATFIRYSLGIALVSLCVSILLSAFAFLNSRQNKHVMVRD